MTDLTPAPLDSAPSLPLVDPAADTLTPALQSKSDYPPVAPNQEDLDYAAILARLERERAQAQAAQALPAAAPVPVACEPAAVVAAIAPPPLPYAAPAGPSFLRKHKYAVLVAVIVFVTLVYGVPKAIESFPRQLLASEGWALNTAGMAALAAAGGVLFEFSAIHIVPRL